MARIPTSLFFSLPYRLDDPTARLEAVLHPDGSSDGPLIVPLSKDETGEVWSGCVDLPKSRVARLRYRYRVVTASGEILRGEPGLPHALPFRNIPPEGLRLRDLWVDASAEHLLAHPALRPFFPKVRTVKKLPPLTAREAVLYHPKPCPTQGN